jgi:Ca-activated chloride channel homolog
MVSSVLKRVTVPAILLIPFCLAQALKTTQAQQGPEPSQQAAEDQSFSLKVNVDLVVLNAIVVDGQGRNVTQLTKDEFAVYEDEVLQSVSQLLPVEAPFNLSLVLDRSSSARPSLPLIKKAGIEFTHQLRPADRIEVGVFDTSVRQLQGLTDDRKALKNAIEGFSASKVGGSSIYDGVAQAVYRLRAQVNGRNAIVILSDGLENSSRIKFDGLRLLLAQSDAVLYPVTLVSKNRQQYQLEAYIQSHDEDDEYVANARQSLADLKEIYRVQSERLQTLAQETGGKVHVISDLAELNGEYSKIASELHHTFSLAYYSSNEKRDGTLRKIRVEVKNPSYKVRTRSHYFVPRED